MLVKSDYTLLVVLPIHKENDLFGSEIRCEVNQVEERGLGEFVDGDISKPDEELGAQLVVNAGKGPAGLLTGDPRPGVDFKILGLTILQLQQCLHGGEEIYLNPMRGEGALTLRTAYFLVSGL